MNKLWLTGIFKADKNRDFGLCLAALLLLSSGAKNQAFADDSPSGTSATSTGRQQFREGEKDIMPVNPLQGLFQPQPQYPSPNKTVMNAVAVQKNLGDDSQQNGRQPGSSGNLFQPAGLIADQGLSIDSLPGGKDWKGQGDRSDDVPAADDKASSSNSRESKFGEKSGEADQKDGKKENAENSDKKTDEEKKEGDKGDGKKDESKKAGEKKEEKGDGKKKDDVKKDGEKKADGAKSEAKKDDEKTGQGDKKDGEKDSESEKKEEKVHYAPYNPIREAILLMNANKFTESLDLLGREIQKASNNPQLFYTRAVVYVRMRRYQLASDDYKQVLKISPTGALADMAKAGLSKIHF